MSRRDFEADMQYLASIKVSQLEMAAEEERQKKAISDDGVRRLLQHLKITSGHVVGTNQSRASIHSKIWSLSIKFGPLSLWVTINPSDFLWS
jgi:hypothetical protein